VTAADLLTDLTRQGFRLTPEGDSIRVTPASRLTGELRHAIRAHKSALLALLAAPGRVASACTWDQAEAERLLADLRTAVERIKRHDFGGRPSVLFLTLAADAVAIAEGHIRNHEAEAARGWDVLEQLREEKRVLLNIARRALAMQE
jgi:hypothetical protein